jgi:hypothetical protein
MQKGEHGRYYKLNNQQSHWLINRIMIGYIFPAASEFPEDNTRISGRLQYRVNGIIIPFLSFFLFFSNTFGM